ncbi:hypothetical protein P9227_20395 [Bacillus licheniformis]|uniref:hypothetical protein n=1 Tax=Bacillus licheniformis TaxID=1402 RepID=UPI002E1A7F52|nr:hypothetical protein [Bacillus licheniformis]
MKKLFVFISIILGYAGFFFIFLFINNQLSEQNYPEAKQGIINLETWDFQKDGNIALTGEWALYRNQLLSPKDMPPFIPMCLTMSNLPIQEKTWITVHTD